MYINDTHVSERGFGHDSIIHVNTVSLSDVVIYCSALRHHVKLLNAECSTLKQCDCQVFSTG